ncbi:MAG: hypothetical protein DMG73_07230 [Acidobacteria bacterium]|nr:MAG: hypothetical protein DMG73_07230 [Acidobacteriota bacterium]
MSDPSFLGHPARWQAIWTTTSANRDTNYGPILKGLTGNTNTAFLNRVQERRLDVDDWNFSLCCVIKPRRLLKAPDIQQKARMNKREKNEWRELCRAEINKNDPNRLRNIIRRVNEMVEERKAKLSKLSKKTKSAAAGKRK